MRAFLGIGHVSILLRHLTVPTMKPLQLFPIVPKKLRSFVSQLRIVPDWNLIDSR
jgi:hypothetical protein